MYCILLLDRLCLQDEEIFQRARLGSSISLVFVSSLKLFSLIFYYFNKCGLTISFKKVFLMYDLCFAGIMSLSTYYYLFLLKRILPDERSSLSHD